MQKLSSRLVWGAILIAAGLIFLLESLGFLFIGSVWPVFFGIAGVLFLITFVRDTRQWWSVIPGLTLLGIALVILMNAVSPSLANLFSGSVFLGCLGLSFITILIATKAEQWWAIIPGGILLTLAGVTAISSFTGGEFMSVLFMFGLAATFAIIYFLPVSGQRMRWALYPTIILAVIGILVLTAATHLAQYVWPVALIALGLYVIVKSMRRAE